jgi:hypothetical protein
MTLQEKDGYQLEEGYRLEKIIDRLTYPSNIEFSEAGDIYVTEAGFTYPYNSKRDASQAIEYKNLLNSNKRC